MGLKINMHIHISGGKGFLGRNIFNKLAILHTVTVSDLQSLDVTDKDLAVKKINEYKPDLIIILAGLMGAEKSKKDLYNTFKVNSFGVLNLLEAARLNNVKGVIFLSSITVHRNSFDGKVDEKSKYISGHPYATSKIISEYIVNDYSKYYKLNSIILRPTIIVGNSKGEINAMHEFLDNALEDKEINIFGTGNHKREFIHVDDVVLAIKKSIEYIDNKKELVNETFVISSNESISMIDLANKAIKKIGKGKVN